MDTTRKIKLIVLLKGQLPMKLNFISQKRNLHAVRGIVSLFISLFTFDIQF